MDKTGILHCTYLFDLASLYVEDETLIDKDSLTSDSLTDLIKAKEKSLGWEKAPVRIADSGNPILLSDWSTKYQMPFGFPKKTSVRADVNEVRVWLKANRIIIHPRCKMLILALKEGTWKKDAQGNRTNEFARTNTHGHLELGACLCYAVRQADQWTNPVPATYGLNLDPSRTFMPEQPVQADRRIPRSFRIMNPDIT